MPKSTLNKSVKRILKNKKMNPNEKFENVANLYYEYFARQFPLDVNMSTFEKHYESFMHTDIDGKTYKIQNKYEKCFQFEMDNMLYVDCVTLAKIATNCIQKGLDSTKLTSKSKLFFEKIMEVNSICQFGPAFDYSSFYFNKKTRFNISRTINKFYDNILNEFIKNYEKEAEPIKI